MKQKIRDFIHESVDIDVCDDYTEECYIAFWGPMWLTPEGEREFKDALDLEVEYKPGGDIVSILVDDPDEDKAERNLKAVYHLFYALAGFDSTQDEYDRWFTDEEPKPAEPETEMECWVKVTIGGSRPQIKTWLEGNTKASDAEFLSALHDGRIRLTGDAYVSSHLIEAYNGKYGTAYEETDWECYLPKLTLKGE